MAANLNRGLAPQHLPSNLVLHSQLLLGETGGFLPRRARAARETARDGGPLSLKTADKAFTVINRHEVDISYSVVM